MATDSETKSRFCLEAALDKKAIDPVLLELTETTSIADYFLICSGKSDRQVQAIGQGIEETLKRKGIKPIGSEGMTEAKWVLIDYGDVVVHIFLEPVRKFYDLEGLWSDAPRIDLFEKEAVLNKGQADQKKGLDKKTLAKFKKILLKEREQIVGDVKQIVESSNEMGQDGIQDIGDEAANIYTKQVLLSLNENERSRLHEVDEALDRLKNGTYGVCEECGDPIGLKRIEVRPIAKYCVPCKTKMEKGRL